MRLKWATNFGGKGILTFLHCLQINEFLFVTAVKRKEIISEGSIENDLFHLSVANLSSILDYFICYGRTCAYV